MAELEAQAPPLQPPLHNTAAPREREPDPADIERYRKWWEERKLRKLRGQYESALVQLSELVSIYSKRLLQRRLACAVGRVFRGLYSQSGWLGQREPLNPVEHRVRACSRRCADARLLPRLYH